MMANVMNIDDPRLNCDKKIDELHFNEISLEEAIKDVEIQQLCNDNKNFVLKLQELLKNYNITPNYELMESINLLKQSFIYKVTIDYKGDIISTVGIGDSEKHAKNIAAEALINKFTNLFINDNKNIDIQHNNNNNAISIISSNALTNETEKNSKSYYILKDSQLSLSAEKITVNIIKSDDKSTRIETSEVFENISKVEPNEYVNQSNSICLGQNFTFFKNLFTLHDFADIQNKNSISLLQELLIRHKIVPKYELVYCKGPEHCPKFCYRISFSNIKNYIEEFGYGYTKKEAKYSAANSLINKIFLSIKNTENKRPVEYEIKEAKINSGPHKRTMNEKLDKNDNLSNMSENYENDINTNDNKIISFEENLKNFALMCRKEIELKNHHGNPIGLLQEMCVAKRFLLPNYEIVEEKGLPHCKEFTVVCILGKYRVTGFGYRKKDAKHNAAFNMIQRLKEISESVKGVIDKIK